ncbi:putative alpha/beta hydrolase-1 [Septoria linicola]|nr:putative alpha/beta hydrolase-1 [Septoria linicola]
MINSTPADYVFIRICIFGLGAIVPVSVMCTIYSAVLPWVDTDWALPAIPLPLHIYFAVETLFWLFFQLPLYYSLQKEATHPPVLLKQERQQLFDRVIKDVSAAELERHIRWWFRGAKLEEIGRDGVEDWLAWAFFEGRIGGEGAGAELDEYTRRFEQLLGKSFTTGYGKAKPIRLTLDKIELYGFRSLAWYFCVGFVDFLTYLRLCRNGYHHHRLPLKNFFALFPFRPVALTAARKSPVEHLTYWHRPHTAKDRLPVVFIHGIGIGLYPYVNFLDDLIKHVDGGHENNDHGQIGIIALEIMPVSFRITHAALSKEDMCKEINTILEHHGFDRFVLVGHSYGTVGATHVLHDKVLQPKVASVLLIDPVCFLLHNPDVAYNFTVRCPKQANEWQLWYFASQDPGVAHTLGRRFFWSQNVLWLDDLLPMMDATGMKVTVSLAGRDLIVDTDAVGRYLVSAQQSTKYGTFEQDWKQKEWTGEGLEVIWNEDRDHAQVFDSMPKRAKLVKVVQKYCEGTT